MVDIMTHLHQYVPMVSVSKEQSISTGEIVQVEKATVHPTIICGDQLTAARARGAIKVKINSETAALRLAGIIPAIEDWHTKVILLEVCTVYNTMPLNMY